MNMVFLGGLVGSDMHLVVSQLLHTLSELPIYYTELL